MKKHKLFISIVIVVLSTLTVYSKLNGTTTNPLKENNSSESYFPVEVGQYWKYKCEYKHGTTSSSITEETESEVLVQIISKKSEGVYIAMVTKDPCNIYQITITINENGDIYNDGKIMLCKSKTSLNPKEFKSILNYPIIIGGEWITTGKMNITESANTIETKYEGSETYASPTVASHGNCDHYFDEIVEEGKGMIYTSYSIATDIATYNTTFHDFVYYARYDNWTYTLIESGVKAFVYEPQVKSWIPKNNIIGDAQIDNAASFSIDNYAFVGTGDKTVIEMCKDFYRYDPGTDSWMSAFSLPDEAKARKNPVTFSVNGKGYICGGFYKNYASSINIKDLWQYDPIQDTCIRKADFPRMGGISQGSAFTIGSKAYVGLGYADPTHGGVPFGYMKDFYEYDFETDQWEQLSDFPGGERKYAIGFSMNGKGYIGLGFCYKSGEGSIYYRDFWEYDPSIDSWTQLTDFPGEGRMDAIGYGYNGNCYVGMGKANDLYIYYVDSAKWSSPVTHQCMEARTGAFSFMINDKFYYGSGGSYSDLWEYSLSPNVYVNPISEMEKTDVANDFYIFPNPMDESFTISGIDGDANYILFDITGRKLLQGQLEDNTYLPVNNLSRGTYILQLSTKKGLIVKKLIKE